MYVRPTLGYHQDVVEGMMDAGEPFGEVEAFIDEAAARLGTSRQRFGFSPGRRGMRGFSAGKRWQ